jgi:RND family efflux transporter MFP subunit
MGIFAALAIGGYVWYGANRTSTKMTTYVTEPIARGTVHVSASGSGNVTVDQLATVDPTITGTVSELTVKVGDAVKKGQTLFVIVNDQLSVDVAKAAVSRHQTNNAVVSAEVNRKQARSDYENAKKEDDRDHTAYTTREMHIFRDKVAVAEQAVELAKENLSVSALTYRKVLGDAAKREVTAPIDGTVNEINIKNGDDLSKISSGNSTKVSPMIISDLKTLQASVRVNEADIAKVSVGQSVKLVFGALDDVTLDGKVEKLDPLGSVSQGVVTYAVLIAFDHADERIRPNMSVSASILSDTRSDVLLAPNAALKEDARGSFVELLENGLPKRQAVEAGIADATRTEIVSGVREGDQVIVRTVDPNTTATSSLQGFRIPGLGGGSGTRGLR